MSFWRNVYVQDDKQWIGFNHRSPDDASTDAALVAEVSKARCLYRLKVTLKRTP